MSTPTSCCNTHIPMLTMSTTSIRILFHGMAKSHILTSMRMVGYGTAILIFRTFIIGTGTTTAEPGPQDERARSPGDAQAGAALLGQAPTARRSSGRD